MKHFIQRCMDVVFFKLSDKYDHAPNPFAARQLLRMMILLDRMMVHHEFWMLYTTTPRGNMRRLLRRLRQRVNIFGKGNSREV